MPASAGAAGTFMTGSSANRAASAYPGDMSSQHQHHHKPKPAVWFLIVLGAGAATGVAWLVARTRRDRLVAEAGEVLHPVATPTTPLPDSDGHVAGNDDAAPTKSSIPSAGPAGPAAPTAPSGDDRA